MTQKSKHSIRGIFIFVCVFLFCGAYQVDAEGQSLSVTPPLFQLSVSPGDAWQSAIKVVNPNSYPLTVRAEVYNFEATGESGYGKFTPVNTDQDVSGSLAKWITLAETPYTIAPEQGQDIPFTVQVPKDASPGGHYAAILISTEPNAPGSGQVVQTVQTVTSLFFLRVEGDVHEEGNIREFRALDSVVDTPNVTFSLRFENKGNVHVQPRGDIIITNMWGTERGRIPVNEKSDFGNVLPGTIRDFKFLWTSDFKITDIGRYKAQATLAYGENGVQSTDAVAYFWIIPVKWTMVTLLVLALFIALITLIVRTYIRRVLALSGVEIEDVRQRSDTSHDFKHVYTKAAAPIAHGVLDLRTRLHNSEEHTSRFVVYKEFVRQYKFFFLSVFVLLVIGILTVWYVRGATAENQNYEVRVLHSL